MKQVSLRAIGMGAGLLFFAHAMIPNSHAWPMIWPLSAGVFAVLTNGSRNAAHPFRSSVGAAVKAGAIAGVLFVLATVAALLALGLPGMASVLSALGAEGPVVFKASIVAALSFAALLGVLLAALAGALTYPLARKA
ncbi:MAG: hypothetical protein AVDCRST_MAG23-306 [uncultured Sphingosinicella sp.]|uniref:Uncharacterized protein n=1 Tax=uncultured Sphingosinicella sp. TaxID=478748 RepID=A0A6J4TJT6_9SPHN|nr:hypothetical protein [uncultured Sphingosinicella sp.]CAA9524310.1 MAG: hypothetical protein AVDCRST_MAG23-306 [uncultured Sphingosinicella sp.]